MEEINARLQSTLGRVRQDRVGNYAFNMSSLTIGKITKVHHQRGTVDVETMIGEKYTDSNKGYFAPKIPQRFGYYDEETGKAWGTVTPVCVGMWVILGFVNKLKAQPIILAIISDNLDETKNVYSIEKRQLSESIEGYDRKEALKSLSVYPSMAWSKINGSGDIEFSHPSNSFLAIYNSDTDSQDQLIDAHMGFDHWDLSEMDYNSNPLESAYESDKKPPRMLFVHRSAHERSETTWTKMYIDEKGTFRLTRDPNDDTLTYMEFTEKGDFRLRRMLDSPYTYEVKDYTELYADREGDMELVSTIDDKENNIFEYGSVGVDGKEKHSYMRHSSDSFIELSENLEIETPKGEIISESLNNFVEKWHIVVSPTEPQDPQENLVWIRK